ncbi:hypothetical protein ACQEVF_45220 [Nonomuraea polychroma]
MAFLVDRREAHPGIGPATMNAAASTHIGHPRESGAPTWFA